MRDIKAKAYYFHKDGTVEDMAHQDTRPGVVFKWKEDGQPVKVCLSTGQIDKTGVGIYDGDIVKESMLEVPLLVKFSCGQWVMHDGKGPDLPLYDERLTVYVIGNIHQNPDVLTPA